MKFLVKALNFFGLYTKKQVDIAFENGRQKEMYKMYVIDTNGIVLQSHPSKWLEQELKESNSKSNYEARYSGYWNPFSDGGGQ